MTAFAWVPVAALADDLSPAPFRLLVGLFSFADSEGRCWPGRRTLANRAGVSFARVPAAIKTLVASGWLTVDRGGGRGTNRYQIHTPDRLVGHKSDQEANLHSDPGGSETDLQGYQDVASWGIGSGPPGVSGCSPKQTKELTIEQTTTTDHTVAPGQPGQDGGGFPSNLSEEKIELLPDSSQAPPKETITTIVNSQIILGAGKATTRQIVSLFARHQLPEEIMAGMIRTVAQAAESGSIRTSADRYIGGLIGRYRDGAYVPEAAIQRETAAERREKLDRERMAQEGAERADKARRAKEVAELDRAKADAGEDRVAELRKEFIASLEKGSFLAARTSGMLFEGVFSSFLRERLL